MPATLVSSTELLVTTLVLTASYARAQIGTDTTSPAQTEQSSSGDPSQAGFNETTEGQSNQSKSTDTVGLVNYYFVFLALVVCIAGVAAYLMYKRKQKYGAFLARSRGHALERDVGSHDSRARRRYWQGRWRSSDQGREEGLNEYGEAPPPYMPKTREEELNPNVLAVPMQTLSRDEAGLNKPPDYYAPADFRSAQGEMQQLGVGSSQPSQPQQSHIHQRSAV